jgi:hypothetical protein
VKLNSWQEIGSDCDVLLTPYVPKGITGYDDDDESTNHLETLVLLLSVSATKKTIKDHAFWQVMFCRLKK